MGKPRIDELEQAIIDAIKTDDALGGYVKTVETLGSSNVEFSSQRFIALPPAVLVYYAGGEHEGREITDTHYRHTARFTLFACASNLRGVAEAKRGALGDKGCYDLLDDLRTLFAGKALDLPSNAGVKPHCSLGAISAEQMQDDMAIYSMEIQALTHWDKV